MKPKYLAALLMLILPITWASSALVDAVPFTYTTNSAAITITGYTGSGGALEIPSTIDSFPVTAIGYDAFFGCTGLTEIVIPDSVASIGNSAFFGCTGLTEIVIPDSVASIGNSAFSGCTGLKNVVIPGSVSSIGFAAFAYCTHLTNIAVAAANQSYASLGGVLFYKELTTLVKFPGGLAGSYTIPDSVTRIRDSAFCGCTGLTNVVIPSSVASIGDYAFSGCTGLKNVVIPGSVTTIGEYAFSGYNGVQEVYFQGNAPTAPDNVFSGGTGTIYYLYGTTGWEDTFGGWPTEIIYPFTYTTNSAAITITGYTGSGGHVEIPETIDGFLLQPLAILRSADTRAWKKR